MAKLKNSKSSNNTKKPIKVPKPPKEKAQKKSLFGGLFKKKELIEETELEEEIEEEIVEDNTSKKTFKQVVFLYADSSIYEQAHKIYSDYEGIEVIGCSDAYMIKNQYSEYVCHHIIFLITDKNEIAPITDFLKSLEIHKLPENSLSISFLVTKNVQKDLLPNLQAIPRLSKVANILQVASDTIPNSALPNAIVRVISSQPTHLNLYETKKAPLPKIEPPNKIVPPSTSISKVKSTLQSIVDNRDLSKDIDNVINSLINVKTKEELSEVLDKNSPSYHAVQEVSDVVLSNLDSIKHLPAGSQERSRAILALTSTAVTSVSISTKLVEDIVNNAIEKSKHLAHEIDECLKIDLELNNTYEATSEELLARRSTLRTECQKLFDDYQDISIVSRRALTLQLMEYNKVDELLTTTLDSADDELSPEVLQTVVGVIKTIRNNKLVTKNAKTGVMKSFEQTLDVANKLIEVQGRLIELDDEILENLSNQKEHLMNLLSTHVKNNNSNIIADTRFKERACLCYCTDSHDIYDIFKISLTKDDVIIKLTSSHEVYSKPISIDRFLTEPIETFKDTEEPLEINANTTAIIKEEDILPRLEYLTAYKRNIYIIADASNRDLTSIESILLSNVQTGNIITSFNNSISQTQNISDLRYRIASKSGIAAKRLVVLDFIPSMHLTMLEELKANTGISLDSWNILKVPPIPQLKDANTTLETKLKISERIMNYIRV